jgi:glycosyltransferase involved in cell wall biosynthesis
VASRVGSLPEMIGDRVSGFLCDVADVSGFCQRILQLASEPEPSERMGIAAQRLSAEKYGADGMLGSYERMFQSTRKDGQRIATTYAPR